MQDFLKYFWVNRGQMSCLKNKIQIINKLLIVT
jgi:hypothetical protein